MAKIYLMVVGSNLLSNRSSDELSGFYGLRVFLSGNTHDIFFNVKAKKKKKCLQSNNKRISAAQIRVIGKSHLRHTMKQIYKDGLNEVGCLE